MIISVWRYSHFALAVSSFLFITLASVTGIILAMEPVMEQSKGYRADDFDRITLSQSIPAIKAKLHGVQEIKVNDYDFVVAKFSDKAGNDKTAYINPLTADVLGFPEKQKPVFEWTTALHRSLFLHQTGRIIVGVTAFLLILIALSGMALIIQRQRRLKRFFAPIEKTGFAQYYHAVFGRVSLVFILALALSGAYLSLSRFVIKPQKQNARVDEANIKEEPQKKLADFAVFQQTKLSQVEAIQFPFSEFPEDFYILKLKDRELCVNQITGDILAEQLYPSSYALGSFSLRWHTGRSSVIWAIVLAITSGYILFFIYSGFVITWHRLRNRSKNRYKADESEIIILVGSENGSTFRFAGAVCSQLIKHGKKAYVADLDKYALFPKAEHLLIMTSTYGEGEPPSNARKFIKKLIDTTQQQPIQFAVVGFGSRSYTHFAQFAMDVDHFLRHQPWSNPVMEMMTVNEGSPEDFQTWLETYANLVALPLVMPHELLQPAKQKLRSLVVTRKTETNTEDVFLIRMKGRYPGRIASGDLLAVYPKNDHRERLYSIGKVGDEIQLSVKLHEDGLGSNFLYALRNEQTIQARIIKNQHFRFPAKAARVIMVSNGTGIAPFLGMIDENKRKVPCTMYCGFRTASSFELFQAFLSQQMTSKKLENYHLALSREDDNQKQYVSHLLERDQNFIWDALANGGVIMICGSLSMQRDVLTVLETLCAAKDGFDVIKFQDNGQILTDCY